MANVLAMSLRVGDEVWRTGMFGIERGEVTGRIGEHDVWYVTVGPGQTYICQGSDLQAVVSPIRPAKEHGIEATRLNVDGV